MEPGCGSRTDDPVMLDETIREFACRVEVAAWRTYLGSRAEEVTANDKDRETLLGWTRTGPTASQLGKLRGLLNGARSEKDLKAVRKWLKAKPKGWDGAGDKLRKILDDPFAVPVKERASEEKAEAAPKNETGGQSGPSPAVIIRDDAPSTLTLSLRDIRKNEVLKRYAIAAIVYAALRAHRRDAEDSAMTVHGEPEGDDQEPRREAG